LPRCVEPEWLDELPVDDPRAQRSRRDLRRVNVWMRQAGIMAAALLTHGRAAQPRMLLEIGAGDGTFMLRVARKIAPAFPGLRVLLLDRQDLVSRATCRAFAALGWDAAPIVADVFSFLPRADVVTANLFLHHFEQPRLTQLLARIARATPLLIACEPRRATFALAASRMLWAIGCNDVSRHDAVVSVHAGFAGTELSAIWPEAAGWTLHERPAGLFSHCFVAHRAGGGSAT
jgi:hypothetical protein